jgi:hypothetical protein
MAELKHIGRVKATNKKCLVAYRTLPGDAYYCLVIPTENLPDIYHDALINLVESTSGQDAYEFAEALDRTQFPDGSNMLRNLHASGRLIKVGTSDIEMTPTTGFSIQLSELNQLIAEQRGLSVDDLSLKSSTDPKDNAVPKVTDEQLVKNDKAVDTKKADAKPTATVTTTPKADASPEEQAKFFRSQADKLAKEAAEMRRKAEELVPTKKKIVK